MDFEAKTSGLKRSTHTRTQRRREKREREKRQEREKRDTRGIKAVCDREREKKER